MTAAPSVLQLVAPRVLAGRNAVRRTPLRHGVLAVFVALFWVGCFALFSHVLGYFQTIGDFGPLLTQRLLVLLFVSFFGILLISNTVTALTTFYLAADVPLLLAAPLPFRRLHHARFLETVLASSWMVLLFGLPAFLAYGVVYGAGVQFYLGTLAVLVPFLIIPAALGVLVTTLLVLVFPARGTRDALLLGTCVLVGATVLGVRLLSPERLVDPSGLVGFAGFLARFGSSGSPWLPTTWAAEVLIPLLGTRPGDPLFYLGMLASTALMLFFVCATIVEGVFLTAWSRAQSGSVRASTVERPLARWLGLLARPLPRLPGLLLVKDATIFLRDAGQWSQLVLLLALVGVYVYNFAALPLDDGSPLALAMRDLAAVLNLALGAFVTTAVAVRFVYPMPSLEGRAWWIVRTAPVPLTRVWWSKFAIGFVPLLAFGEVLVASTNGMLGVDPALTAVFLVTLVPLTAAVVSLGLAFGAVYPKLDTHNAAQIATGFGAIIYMVASLGLIALVVALEAWPVARLFWHGQRTVALAPVEWVGVVAGLGMAAAVTVAAFVAARRTALRALARLSG
jgi:ABC-2 type transport system permease protein